MVFKKARFVFKTNAALAQLGVNPLSIHKDVRGGISVRYLEFDRTPKEAACIPFAQVGIAHQRLSAEETNSFWEDGGLVDRNWHKAIS